MESALNIEPHSDPILMADGVLAEWYAFTSRLTSHEYNLEEIIRYMLDFLYLKEVRSPRHSYVDFLGSSLGRDLVFMIQQILDPTDAEILGHAMDRLYHRIHHHLMGYYALTGETVFSHVKFDLDEDRDIIVLMR